jgi:hypothetical protein
MISVSLSDIGVHHEGDEARGGKPVFLRALGALRGFFMLQ